MDGAIPERFPAQVAGAEPIETPRLRLVPLVPEVLQALLDRDWRQAGNLLGADGTAFRQEAESIRFVLEMRLGQLTGDPSLLPWLLRAMVSRETNVVVGHIGFHSRPNPEYLAVHGLYGLELGYTVLSPFRRRGYARESISAMMAWADTNHGVTRFVLSISPENGPSIALASALGFRKVTSHVDPIDGPEDIYVNR